MKKLKLILPFATLATIPAVVMPLTACNKLNDYNLTWTKGEEFPTYTNRYTKEDFIYMRDVFPEYIDEFKNINKTIALDIGINIYQATKWAQAEKIEINNCFFDTFELRLTNDIMVQTPSGTYKLSVSNLKYCSLPGEENNDVWFVPDGTDGTILQDKAWYIEFQSPGEKTQKLDCNTKFDKWVEWWEGHGQHFLTFKPQFYLDVDLI